jgi:hypothetical protein
MWKSVIVAYFEVQYQNLPGGTEETHKNLRKGRLSLSRDMNSEPPQYESRADTHPDMVVRSKLCIYLSFHPDCYTSPTM